jgi:hypothetical protein
MLITQSIYQAIGLWDLRMVLSRRALNVFIV